MISIGSLTSGTDLNSLPLFSKECVSAEYDSYMIFRATLPNSINDFLYEALFPLRKKDPFQVVASHVTPATLRTSFQLPRDICWYHDNFQIKKSSIRKKKGPTSYSRSHNAITYVFSELFLKYQLLLFPQTADSRFTTTLCVAWNLESMKGDVEGHMWKSQITATGIVLYEHLNYGKVYIHIISSEIF